MTFIYLDQERERLKSYSAAVKGAKGIVKIEIECSDHRHLGYLLSSLEEIDREQKNRERSKPATKRTPLALPAPIAQLPYFGGDE